MTKDFIQDPVFPECPIRNVLARIGGKWTLAVLYTLGGSDMDAHGEHAAMRFKDIEKIERNFKALSSGDLSLIRNL